MLIFQRLTKDYYWANADGSDGKQYGQPGYEVRFLQGRWRAVAPDNIILGHFNLCTQAQERCQKDAVGWTKRETEWCY